MIAINLFGIISKLSVLAIGINLFQPWIDYSSIYQSTNMSKFERSDPCTFNTVLRILNHLADQNMSDIFKGNFYK